MKLVLLKCLIYTCYLLRFRVWTLLVYTLHVQTTMIQTTVHYYITYILQYYSLLHAKNFALLSLISKIVERLLHTYHNSLTWKWSSMFFTTWVFKKQHSCDETLLLRLLHAHILLQLTVSLVLLCWLLTYPQCLGYHQLNILQFKYRNV